MTICIAPVGRPSPATVVIAAHEHLAAAAADRAVGLVAVVVILIRALQEAVLQRKRRKKSVERPEGSDREMMEGIGSIFQRAEGGKVHRVNSVSMMKRACM